MSLSGMISEVVPISSSIKLYPGSEYQIPNSALKMLNNPTF